MITDHPYNDSELALPFNVLYYILYSDHVTALPFLTFKHVLLHEDNNVYWQTNDNNSCLIRP